MEQEDSHSSEDETNETESSDSQDDNPDDEPVLRQSKRIASNYGKALTERKSTVYWEIFASLNFREFHVSFPIREILFREILGGVAHY